MPTIKDIVMQWLQENGFDGLANPGAECGCGLDDLAPCMGEDWSDCQPAKKRICPSCDPVTRSDCNYQIPGEACFYVEKTNRYWQHDETGRVVVSDVEPFGDHWFEIDRQAYIRAVHPMAKEEKSNG